MDKNLFNNLPWRSYSEEDGSDIHFGIKIFGYQLFYFFHHVDIGWFRIFGVGLHWKNVKTRMLLFGERNGYTKYLMLGNWMVKYLPKSKFGQNKKPRELWNLGFLLTKLKDNQKTH